MMIRRHSAPLLLFGYLLFVVYGSLVPLDYRPLPFDEAWRRFQAMPFLQLGVASRADWIANGVLYAPIGFLVASGLLRRGWWRVVAGFIASAFGIALALGVEFSQVYFPARTVSLNDVLAECIGSVLGAFAALAYSAARPRLRQVDRHLPGAWLKDHGWQLYLVAYVAFCLFPYDLLISSAELEQKLASDLWGWWIAGHGQRFLLVALQLGIEVALTAPLGALIGQRANGRSAPGWGRAAWVGLAVGLAIEGAQLLIASGTTQGASVLARVLGAVIGLALWQRRHAWSEDGVRIGLVRTGAIWFPAYLLLLMAVNGWFLWEWQGLEAMRWRLGELRFLPFYYHYYTSEASALTSLAAVSLMYLPVGALAWALRRSAVVAAVWGGLVCLSIEVSKLSLAGLHPDTTNLWIAAAACWVLVRGAEAWSSRAASVVAQMPVTAGSVTASDAASASPGALRNLGLSVAALLLVAGYFWSGPAFAVVSVLLLTACAAAVWVRPGMALLIVPALLPVLDLAPWTGRFFWDEFDLLLMVCLLVGYLRTPQDGQRAGGSAWHPAFALLALSLTASMVKGAMPWPWPDANSWVSYYSPYNALRIFKGALWAWLFVGLFRRIRRSGQDAHAPLASGMTLGLACVVAFVLWERLAFVGLFDFADVYRVTGPFSAMHRGGAFIECYIAVATPFAVLRVLESRRWSARVAGVLLLVGASYAMMVTFSRNGYAAFGVALLLLLLLSRRADSTRQAWFGGLLAAAILAAVLPVLLGSFAQERLSRWAQDLSIRQAHWGDALAMRDGDAWTTVFGMGLGRFPETHYWRSREPVHAGSYRLESEGELRYLQLAGGGGGLYIDQLTSISSAQPHRLALRVRSNKPASVLELSVCEKWMLTSRTCVEASVRAADTPNTWSTSEVTIDLTPLAAYRGILSRPVKLSMHTPEIGTSIDVTDIRLLTDSGDQLLSNGDFRHGLDRWFFSTDIDPPWHIHSLPVAILFDQGWFGAVAWTLLLVTAIGGAARSAWRGHRHAAAALAALLAFLVSGSLNTLIDEPRFLFLLLLMSWLSSSGRFNESRTGRAGRR